MILREETTKLLVIMSSLNGEDKCLGTINGSEPT